ncbi:MAG: EAL domain-containing protein [Actinomycetia bacterium]|nr:EAL domain-containing protein [Actinomycetes bacterium]MCH9800146.1 EAL domain-containing protein [Actinomycetes bacterium]
MKSLIGVESSQLETTASERRATLLIALGVLLVSVPIFVWGSTEMTPNPFLIASGAGGVFVVEVFLAFAFLTHTQLSGSRFSLIFGIACAAPAITVLPWFLLDAAVMSEVDTGLGNTLRLLGKAEFLALVVIGFEVRRRDSQAAVDRKRVFTVVGWASAAVLAVSLLLGLPIAAGWESAAAIQFGIAALASLIAVVGPLMMLKGWGQADRLQTTMFLVVVAVGLGALSASIYSDPWTLGWYANRIINAVAAFVALLLVMVVSRRLEVDRYNRIEELDKLRQEQQRHYDRLWEISRTDDLTQLATRPVLIEEIRRCLAESRNSVLVLVDLDGFKGINDRYGHAAGDALLQNLAERLRANGRPEDICARMGGDEFAIFLHDAEDLASVHRRLEQIVRGLSAPVDWEHTQLTVTASAGYTVLSADDQDEQLAMYRADVALYGAKAQGGNRVVRFRHAGPTMFDVLDAAVCPHQQQRLVLYYQPVRSLSGGQVHHYEALLRLRDIDGSVRSASDLLQMFGEHGRMGEIGHRVLDQVMLDLSSSLLQVGRISINLSSQELVDPLLLDRLLNGDIAAHRNQIILEVDEANVRGDEVAEIVRSLKSGGYAVAVDNFGSGGGNLIMLDHISPVLVKLSSDFSVHAGGLQAGARRLRIAADVIRELGALSVIKGLETEQESWMANATGVDLAQGLLLGAPLAPANLSLAD